MPPPKFPPPGGNRAGRVALEIHRARKQESGGQVGPWKPPASEARGGWAWPLPPPPSHPGAPPPHTPSPRELGATYWCSHSSCGEGGGKDSPLGNPFPGAPLKMVQTLPGQSHLPLPTRTHLWLRSSWYPSIETLKLDSVTRSLGPLGPLSPTSRYSPCLGHLQVGRFPPIGNSPLALVEFIRPSAHPSIRPGPHLAARHR